MAEAKRKPISKKLRMEVFKRDKFTCQYCGRMSPDVILEVDHIKPVAEGGTNDILNLITSCRDCNRGKGKRRLDDDVELRKQQEQLKDLAERKEQLEMMVKWKDELLSLEDKKVDMFEGFIKKHYGKSISLHDQGRQNIKKWLKQYPLDLIIDAFVEAMNSLGNDTTNEALNMAFDKIPSIAYYMKNPMSERQKKIYYLRKILINRLNYVDKGKAYRWIDELLDSEFSFEELKSICSTCKHWTDFRSQIGR